MLNQDQDQADLSAKREKETADLRMNSIISTLTVQRDNANNAVVNAIADKAMVEAALKAEASKVQQFYTAYSVEQKANRELQIVIANLQSQINEFNKTPTSSANQDAEYTEGTLLAVDQPGTLNQAEMMDGEQQAKSVSASYFPKCLMGSLGGKKASV